MQRKVIGLLVALVAMFVVTPMALAQWPTTCVELNDIVEAHLGNDNNVGIYQRVFGDQAEQACQNDHRDDVRSVFAWAIGGDAVDAPVVPPTPPAAPTAPPAPPPAPTAPAAPAPPVATTGDCTVGLVLRAGGRCTYPGTDLAFTVLSSGHGRFAFIQARTGIRMVNSTLGGVRITFVALNQGDDSWIIERVGS